MAAYDITAPDGKTYRLDGPAGASKIDLINALAAKYPMAVQTTEELEAAPRAPSSAGNLFRGLSSAVLGGTKSLVDVTGAGTGISKSLGEASQFLESKMTPERQEEMQRRQELIERANRSGSLLKEAKAYLGGVFEAPLESTVRGIGSSTPSIIAGLAALPLEAPAALALGVSAISRIAVGAAQGVGEYKGGVFDTVKAKYMEAGYKEPEAERLAIKAQEYSADKALELGGSALLGALDAYTGIEAAATGAFRKVARPNTPEGLAQAYKGLPKTAPPLASPNILGSAARSVAGEAPIEGLQGGFGQFAQNLAVSKEGFEQAPFEGVLGSSLRDAAVGALVGGTFTPLNHAQRSRDFALDQYLRTQGPIAVAEQERAARRKEIEEANALTKEQLGIKAPPLMLEGPKDKLFKPDEEILRDPVGRITRNELGNALQDKEVADKVTGYIDSYRSKNNLPPLQTFSLEDIKDAMTSEAPAGELGALQSILAYKTGFDNETISADDVLYAAEAKEIATGTQGFKDFLERATGSSDLDTMSDVQRFSAFKALSSLNKRETGRETVLRPGTNASRFTQDQFDEGLTTLAQYINQENGKLAMPEAIEIIKAQTSLKTDRDAYTLLNNAAAQNMLNLDRGEVFNVVDRNGDITSTHTSEERAKEFAGKRDTIEKQTGEIISIAELPKAKAPLPKGYAINKQTVEGEVTPAGYAISAPDAGKPLTIVEQVEDLKAKVEQMEGARRAEANKELAGALRIQQALQQRSDSITKMEALGQADTIGYKKLKSQQLIAEREFSKRIQSLLDRAERLNAPLKTKPVGRNVQPKDVYTLTKDGKTVGKFKNEDEAYASMFLTPETEGGLSDKELEDIAVKGGNLGDRAFKAIEARQTKGFKVKTTPEVRAKAEFQAKADEIAKNLLPMLKRFGLEDVGLNIVSAIENGAQGAYLNKLIEVAIGAGKQVETLRHEALHALKDLGFFTDAQWRALERQADKEWINKYLKGVQTTVDGIVMSRHDAYIYLNKTKPEEYNKANPDKIQENVMSPKQLLELLREEAIAEAFADFSINKPPAGMIASLLARLNNFFTALRNALNGAGFNTADDIFEKIEAGELKSTRAPKGVSKQLSLGAGRTIPLSTVDLMEMDERSSREELGLKTKKNEGERAGQLNNVREIAIALNKQTIDLFGKMDKGTLTAADVNKLAEAMADEVIYQLGTLDETGTGQGWYSNNYPNAVKMLAKKFEELESNKHARSVFTALVAITSNGEKVNKNIDNAIKLYSKIRLGQPLVAMGNRRANALQNNLVALQELLIEHGKDFEQHLLKETTVKDMNIELRARGESPDGSYLAETTVPTAAIYFGPKLGAFYANLSGSEGYLTMDLWWTRTINRMRGLLIPKATASSIGKFRAMMDRPDATREEVIAAAVPLRDKYFDYGYNTELEHLIGSKEPTKKFKKEAWFKRAQKAAGDSYEQLLYEHSLEKMANTIYKAEYDMLEEKPFSATDRKFMYDAARKTQSLLRERGVRLTLADIQASLWYYEKRLYQKLSGRKADDIGYEEAIIAKADESTGRARPSVVFTGGPNGGSVATGAIQGSEQVREEPPTKDAKLSLKGVIAEVAPNPEREIAGKWREMTPSERLAATTNVANKIMRQVFDELNLKGYTYKFSTGRYEGEQNPNIIVEAPDNASTQDLNKLARFMGYVFDQKAMVAFDETNTTSGDQAGFVKVIVPDGMSPDDLNRLRNLIGSTVPQAEGDTLRDGALLFGNFSAYNDSIETLDNNQFAQALVNAVESFDYDGVIRVSEPETFHSELIWPDNREAYLEGTEYGKSGNIQGEEGRDVRREGRGVIQAIADEAISLRDKWIDARGAARIGSGTKFDEVGVPEPSAEYGEPQEGSVSAVGVHFSKQARPLLVSAMYGTGLRGAENARLSDATDIRPRIYFYVDKGNGIRPEAGVGGVAHVIQLNNLYNATEDKDGIVKNNRGNTVHEAGNNLERSIVKAGYDGYLSLDPLLAQGFAVLLGKHNIETNIGGTKLEGKKYSLAAPDTPAFKRFFAGSKVVNEDGTPKVMYHGTRGDFSEFRAGLIFASPSPMVANKFAANDMLYSPEKPGIEPGANVMPVYVKASNPFDYENPEHVNELFEAIKTRFASPSRAAAKRLLSEGQFKIIEESVDTIKELGFDSLYVEEFGEKNLAVFEPNQVKSATGNIGTYNTSNPDIRYSLGTYFPTAKAAEDAAYAKGPPQTREFKVFFGASKAMEEGRAQPMFHASTEEFDIFRENKPIFISPDAQFAEDFIQRRIKESKSLQYLSEEKRKEAKIYPLWVRSETPFDYENKDHVQMVMEYLKANHLVSQNIEALKKFYPNTEPTLKIKLVSNPEETVTKIEESFARGDWRIVEDGVVQNALKTLGFDSFNIQEGGFKQLAVFKANQVKSITGNIGEFNPENKSIKYSLGSVAYSPERLNNLVGEFSYLQNGAEKSTKGYIGRVNPIDFVNATATPAEKAMVERELKPLNLQELSILPKEMRLTVRKDGDKWEIINHDGRHRMFAFHNAGYTSVPVVIETPRINDAEPIDGKSLRGQSNAILSSVYISDLQPLSYDNKEKVAEAYSVPKPVKYSLPTISAAAQKRVNEATTVTEPKTRFESITEAVFPRSFSYFRQEAINRYNQLSVYDKTLADQMGGKDLLASVSAEQGALFSDLDSGVLAAVMGVGNRQGGVPVYRNGITTVDTSVKGLTEVFAPLAKYRDPVVFQHYQFWAAVKRGLRLIDSGKERNIQASDKIIADEFAAKYPEFEQVQKEWITFNNGMVKYLVDTNVLSQDRANEYMKYADYIPFYRQLDGRETLGPKVFQSLTTVKPPREIHGSDNPLADFLETVVRNTHASIRAGMKNSAALKAVNVAGQVKAAGMGAEKVVDANGNPVVSQSPDTFTVFEKGEKVSYRTPDALLISALTSLNMPELPFMGLISAPANALRNLVTKDPGFMMVNLMRDSLSAYVTSGVNILPIAGSAHQFVKGLMKQSPTMEALLNAGIGGGYEFSQNIERSGANLYADLQKKAGNAPKGLIGLATGVWDALETGTTASDMATRALIYERVMKETGDEAEALKRALEVMNFNRKGRSAVVRILTAAVPFLNARIQGLDVFFRAGVSPTYRSLRGLPVTDQEKAVMRRFWIRGSTMMALSVMYYFAVSDDDEYKKQEQETKDNYWIIPSTKIKIATPFEVGTLFKTIPERIVAYATGNDTGEDFRKAMYRAFNNTIPISPTAYIPQVFKPLLEYSTNFNFFTMRPIVGQGMEGIDAKYQTGPSTSLTFQELGKTLGVSPLKAEQMYKGYTGTIGMYLIDVMDAVMEASGSNPQATKRFEQLPIIKRFALDPQARGDVTAYYELRNSVHTAVATANMLERSDPKEFIEYFKENRGLLANKDYVNDLYKTLKQFNDMRRMVNTSTMSGDEKRAALTNINFAEQNLTKNIQVVKKAIASTQ